MKFFLVKKTLTKNRGVNLCSSNKLVKKLNLPLLNPKIAQTELENLKNLLEMHTDKPINSEHNRIKRKHLKFKRKIRNYQGFRHMYNLSVRGQNTKNNCATQKRKKKK